MAWSAAQYGKFLDDRTRPARDLLSAVPLDAPRLVIDLGCGPGNSTALLIARFPEARVVGVDSDPDMIEAARKALPDAEFALADAEVWQPEEAPDLIFANASMQWPPDHRGLFPRLIGLLRSGGVLAVQMPDNLDEPSHLAMRRVAADRRWAESLTKAAARRQPLIAPIDLFALLRPMCSRVEIWRTTYHPELAGIDGIVEWFKGSALRPYLEPLSEPEQAQFLDAYRREIAPAYTVIEDRVLLPFPRYFFIATANDVHADHPKEASHLG